MIGLKKLDRYILSKFLPLFVGAFFICLFIFMMQFTWRYLDELIGKGLTMDVLAQFFWHMGITLIPTSLPLAILLASLITFGNLGEDLELLAMKAAGVPLIRIMRPILMVVVLMTGVSFYFQNVTGPHAQISLRTLLISMKQAQPAVEIPEGVFYNDLPNINLFVERKNAETGMLYNVIIYKTDQGFDRAQIVLADSGRMEVSADKMHLTLDLWQGALFENLQQENFSALNTGNAPYDREVFGYKRFLIDFDSNFALMDQNMLRDMPQAKSMAEINTSLDSMSLVLDSMGLRLHQEARLRYYTPQAMPEREAKTLAKTTPLPYDSLLAAASPNALRSAEQTALQNIRSAMMDLEWKATPADQTEKLYRGHQVEWHQKITLSLACLLFFFVGAPLGAIIRKGGLGMPAVVSVAIFIAYYIINISGMKMARDGNWGMVYGMWISSAVLLPFGIFLTYKANKDSMVFNSELYLRLFRQVLGLRSRRHIDRKEVIIEDPDYDAMVTALDELATEARTYSEQTRLLRLPNYFRLFFRNTPDHRIIALSEKMEDIVAHLANSRKHKVIAWLNEFPIIFTSAHTTPFERRWANVLCGLCLPLGLVMWLRIGRFRLRLHRDLKQIQRACEGTTRAITLGDDAFMPGESDRAANDDPRPVARRRRRRLMVLMAVAIMALLAGIAVQRCERQQARTERMEDEPAPTTNKTAPGAPERAGRSTTPPTRRSSGEGDADRRVSSPQLLAPKQMEIGRQ